MSYGREVDLLKIRLALLRQNHTQAAAGAIGADISRMELRSVARREQVSAISGGVTLPQILANQQGAHP